MKKITFLLVLLVLVSCKNGADSQTSTTTNLSDGETVNFLNRELRSDPSVKAEVSVIVLNEVFITSISSMERAAVGYVATFVGNECAWDGAANADRSNLQCRILDALDLGYQCSDQHLGFLRDSFEGDSESLNSLASAQCPTTPETATAQTTFDRIDITRLDNQIIIDYEVTSSNLREQTTATWSETVYFTIKNGKLSMAKKEKTEPVRKTIEVNAS